MITLYDYYRSSACYRVRIALNYKKLDYEKIEIHLTKEGGEQHQAAYKNINPQQLVPTLMDGEHVLTQSIAIMEYLEERYPKPHLLPSDPVQRARARAIAQMVACDIHPLNNLRVLQYLVETLGHDEETKRTWYHHWLRLGFDAIETLLAYQPKTGFCVGDHVTIADICLVPQIYNATRHHFSMAPYPCLRAINENCLGMACFSDAMPE